MHALLTRASKEVVLERISKGGVEVRANPDVFVLAQSELSVDDARQISTYAHLKAVSGIKHLIVSFDRAGAEAQNALLKVVEEAPGNSHFYFCTPNPGAIIPTLRSRCIVEGDGAYDVPTDLEEARGFLSASYSDRLSMVEKMVTAAQRSGERGALRAFARALVHVHPARETLDAVRYLDQNGSSPKLVLSHLAVALPRV